MVLCLHKYVSFGVIIQICIMVGIVHFYILLKDKAYLAINFESYDLQDSEIPIASRGIASNKTVISKDLDVVDPWSRFGFTKVLIWNRYHIMHAGFWNEVLQRIVRGECNVSSCAFTSDKSKLLEAEVVLFHFQNLYWEHYKIPQVRPAGQIWILMCYETPMNAANRNARGKNLPRVNYTRFDGIFNLTMNYRLDADITTRHGLVWKTDTQLSEKEVMKYFSPFERAVDFANYNKENWKNEANIEKAPIAWFCSHCTTKSGREGYFKKLASFIGGHTYGGCGKRSCGGTRKLRSSKHIWDDPCFNMTNKNYRFIASFENSMCKDYVTEKIYNALYHNVIPLMMTGPISKEKFLPPHSVINVAQFRDPEHLSNYLYYLLGNETAYMEYFAWRKSYRVRSFFSIPNTCEFCETVKKYTSDQGNQQIYLNMSQWFKYDSKCFSRGHYHYPEFEDDFVIAEWIDREENKYSL